MTLYEAREFADKVAVITGGGAGFGAGFAHALAAQGAVVALLDIDAAAAETVAASVRASGGDAAAHACDVADPGAVAEALEAIGRRSGGIDILINNAGLHSAEYNRSFGELGTAAVRRLFDVNIMGVIHCSLAARAIMARRGGGAIVNIASIAAYPGINPYGVSKLAVRGLTTAFAHEFADDAIRVNAIAPGLIATDRIKADFPEQLFRHFADDLQKIQRTGRVDDIAEAMLFLCSDRASFITGETLKVSGGHPLTL
ncbi:short-chain dehydrogenase [Sphingopyxis lindanitolerans]|uniref:Short-chain dehydrogenase n=1 Tax=Sphingopyxis lindanitolerans TaxID=2054227 RepID=A0A2S8B5R5_9SPHN|nr:SDR family oxidoreductase [Sphingopyxis lindanitolerans]PQM27725.1 short-chain dehydrogenase [Sphingopyxis lindanitolerans]